jgi:hypothetical protein
VEALISFRRKGNMILPGGFKMTCFIGKWVIGITNDKELK